MAFQRVPETVQILVRYSCQGVPFVNTFYARKIGGYILADLSALATAVDQWAGNELVPLLSTSVDYLGVEVRGLDAEEDLIATSVAFASPGLVAVAPMPNNVAVAVKRTAGFTGRNARGRVYFPVHATAIATNENFVTQGFIDALRTALNLLRGVILVLEFIEVIVSRYNEGVKRTEAIVFPVTGYNYTDLRVDTMRGRLS